MSVTQYIKLTIREFIGVEADYESFTSGQEKILQSLEKLEKVEKLDVEVEKQQTHLSDYITAKNIAAFCIFTGLVGLGFYLFYYSGGGPGPDSLSNSNAELYQSMSQLSKDLQTMDQNGIFDALARLNDSSAPLSKQEIKLLIEIKNILLARGVGEPGRPLALQFFNEKLKHWSMADLEEVLIKRAEQDF